MPPLPNCARTSTAVWVRGSKRIWYHPSYRRAGGDADEPNPKACLFGDTSRSEHARSALMIRITLLTVDTTAAAGVAGLFIWCLRGVHRFPYETALFAMGLQVILS